MTSLPRALKVILEARLYEDLLASSSHLLLRPVHVVSELSSPCLHAQMFTSTRSEFELTSRVNWVFEETDHVRLASFLPSGAKRLIRIVQQRLLELSYHGTGRDCPVCGYSSRKFREVGVVRRADAQCVHCSALERHRLVWLFISQRTTLFNGQTRKMLHVAPEACFAVRFPKLVGAGYLSADLASPLAMVKMDITDIAFPNEHFDVIYCGHVLEHVRDDRKALREFHRILRKDGWAILNVPITAPATFEDPSIVSPQARLAAFGQEDHVRRYGPDYVDRLREAGFTVQIFKPLDLVKHEDCVRMGLTAASGEIYFCRK